MVAPAAASAAPAPVPSFDVERYQGQWFQIAAIPQWYQAFCARNTTANYTLQTNGTVGVVNRCTTPWGSGTTAYGNARVKSEAQLQVSFNRLPWGGWAYPSDPNYIVVGLGEDYDWAVTTDSARASGFVLSRTATITDEQRAAALGALREAGINPCRLRVEPQRGGATTGGRFC